MRKREEKEFKELKKAQAARQKAYEEAKRVRLVRHWVRVLLMI